MAIRVDDASVKRDLRLASVELVKRYELAVGEEEHHSVVIEKERERMFAGFRKQRYRVFVDDRLVDEDEGY